MKKFMFVLLAVGLIALAMIPAACDKGTDPGAFSSYSLQGVTFSHPAEWTNTTADLEQSIAQDDPNYSAYMGVAAWGTPSDSAGLFVISLDLQKTGLSENCTMTESDKKSIAESMTVSMKTAMDSPTIVRQEQITVSGQGAWQVEFSGKIGGLSAKGYMLTVISDDTILTVLYAGQENEWTSLRSVYDTVKASIVM